MPWGPARGEIGDGGRRPRVGPDVSPSGPAGRQEVRPALVSQMCSQVADALLNRSGDSCEAW
ncbi:hypothetical protein GCM10018782_11050 [Streptomyces griseoaurantiacus]|nr:hypothetical protein GCM10018782_11050 [Streptomyces griseoaurantiacus]